MQEPTIFDIQKFSVHDGPGIRTIIFLKGCPLRCQWCANPESNNFYPELMFYPNKCIGCRKCLDVCDPGCITIVDTEIKFARDKCNNCGKCAEVCYSGARRMSGKAWTRKALMAEIDKDMVFYKNSGGGITFSGGEPLIYPEFIADISSHYKKNEISTAIETCGYVPWANFEKAIPFLNLVLYDLKFIDDEKHKKYTGESNVQILDNLAKASEMVKTVVRIPIIPAINDTDKDITDIGSYLSSLGGRIKNVNILPYHDLGLNKYIALGRPYSLQHINSPSKEHMEEIKKKLEQYDLSVNIGG